MALSMAKVIHTISDSSSESASGFSEEAVHENVEGNATTNGMHTAKKDEEEEEIEQIPNHPSKTSHTKAEKVESPASMAFPLARVRRLIKSEEDIRTTAEAAFLVNKATEKFLEQFLEDSLEYVPEENKTILGYKQLSLVVANQKRYEFLADFVPQKIRAAEALSQKASGGI